MSTALSATPPHGVPPARIESLNAAAVPADVVNVSLRLTDAAARLPDKAAIIEPSGRRVTFAELEALVNRTAAGLASLGVEAGSRALLFVPPSIELFSMSFALFRLGALPVMIDPGLGRKALLAAIAEARPEFLIGVPRALGARLLFPWAFRSVKRQIAVGRWPIGVNAADFFTRDYPPFPAVATKASDPAAILFTSGSTGPAKGVVYTHGTFDAQVDIIRREWGIGEDEIDLPAFPLFALFSAGLGVTSVLPDMDASRPGAVDPARVIAAIREHRPTYSFGSPAFWSRIAEHCEKTNQRLDSFRRVFIAGAPVAPKLVDRVARILSWNGEVIVPYGATESLPVSWTRGSEVGMLRGRAQNGAGFCVGRPIAESEVRIIATSDEPLDEMPPALSIQAIGEIVVRGPVTTASYDRRPDDDRRAKIIEENGTVWHRMGDLGYFDESGRLWYTGRKSHRVETARGTMHTICCEVIFDQHPRVRRSALVGVGEKGAQAPVIVIEPLAERRPMDATDESNFKNELLAMAADSELTREITEALIYPTELPVDVRHNAKIRREVLAVWAAERLRNPKS